MNSRSDPLRTIRSLDFRHRDENPPTTSPLALALTNCDAHNSFIIRFYEKCRVSLESEKCVLPKPFQFRVLRTLSFSVACKCFACHSYENCRVCTNNSHCGTQFLKNYFNSGRISGGMNRLPDAGFTGHRSPSTSHLLRLTPSPSDDSINSHPAERQAYLAVPPFGGGIP